jgi:uncharacterized repeat protein (TIGR01451 family)
MKKNLLLLFCLTVLAEVITTAQVLRPFTQRYYNPSVRGNIVYVSNSIVSTSGVGSGIPGTGEIAPGGISKDNDGNGINIDIDNPSPVTKLAFGSKWNYFSTGAAPSNDGSGNTWKTSAYALTGSWNTGASPANGAGKYGFGGTQNTCMPSGVTPICTPSNSAKYLSYYFRNDVTFTATELATTYSLIRLNMKRDDGIVVYINGIERVRDNMPTGTISYGTLASSNIATGTAENITYDLDPTFFSAGVNTIAVEVHLNRNSRTDMSYDMEVIGIPTNETFNSSSADLNLSGCSSILFAGLYWGAGEGSSAKDESWIVDETTCKFKVPGAANYTNITSSKTDYYNSNNPVGFTYTGFQCFADVTALLNANSPNGTYTVADVMSPVGKNNAYGGWTMVIVYANPSEQSRNLTVFDGSAIVQLGNPPVDVSISGFLTPASGPVSCELGTVAYDGDRAWTDSFCFKQNGAASFYNLTPNGTANLNDMWNSVIGYKGAVVTTRNPAFQNTLGYDASIIEIPNSSNAQLSNSQTSATVRFSSPQEMIIAHVLTTSITQYNPTFSFDKTSTDLNGGSLLPGDSLRYVINYSNAGNDTSINTVIRDVIPAGTSFIPGSLKISSVSKTDAVADDQAEFDLVNNRVVFRVGTGANGVSGGTVTNGSGGTVQFDVVLSTSCAALSCIGSIKNSARIDYVGKKSGNLLYDSSGVNTAGCIIKGPVINYFTAVCHTPSDSILTNTCPASNVVIPWRKYAGYTFYSAMPFIPANIYNPLTPITVSHIYYAYFNSGFGCADTIKVSVFIIACPDIDDDNDGIPDYVELNNPVALQDANGNGIPNWNDPTYPGFIDNNADGFNDNFDPSADSDNDGIPNFYDPDFPGYIDANGDGVNDNMDKDMDGIPNHLDLDSDNDGIPDVVESYGVDENGDGIIDNYTDTDNDGFSQNVDGSSGGVHSSGVGLGAPDFDGDGIPNYLDTDSDNDGIPDVVEVGGAYAANTGRLSNFVDANSDGLSDNNTGATALLKTGPDANGDGRADNFPYKNLDRDFRPNPYDLDSDGDGIADVIEAGFPDVNYNGIVDGTFGTNGWSTTISAMPTLTLLNTDGTGNPDYLDIDSDDDGIPDNIEGQSTAAYKLPTLTDTDGDGLASPYDNIVGFGGAGIFPYDHDGDGIPDYRDLDTDADGVPDVVEGNDWNLNGIADENVTLTGLDTDGDGLDNRFDSLNSVTNVKGTSYMMGTNGSLTGDATPGTRATVQKRQVSQLDRDWRYFGTALPLDIISFGATPQSEKTVLLNWTITTPIPIDHVEIERSAGNNNFYFRTAVNDIININEQQQFSTTDDISNTIGIDVLYYRLKFISKAGAIKYSNVVMVKKNVSSTITVSVIPNPANSYAAVRFVMPKEGTVTISMINMFGQTVWQQNNAVVKGANTIMLNNLSRYNAGMYTVQLFINDEQLSQKLMIFK